MLLYVDIVKKALDQEALPILKEAVDTALTERFGEEWYAYFARAIMEGYGEFKSVDAFVSGGKGKTIDAFDINAICYLVMPYDKDLKMYLDGAMPMLEEKFGLEANPERLKRIRTIQNNVSRKKLDVDMPEDEMSAMFGAQEKKWLLDIEKTLKEFKPECSLADYLKQLDEAVSGEVEKNRQKKEAVSKRPDAQEVREAYTGIWQFAFSDAPLGKPILGSAPWANENEELKNLPWPSEAEQRKARKAEAESRIADAKNAANMPAMEQIMAAQNAAQAAQNIPQAAEQQDTQMALNLEDFVKPAPAGESTKRMPGTAPNEEKPAAKSIPGTAPNESTVQEDVSGQAEDAEQKEKGVNKLCSWFKFKN